jgi:hypothetical protein
MRACRGRFQAVHRAFSGRTCIARVAHIGSALFFNCNCNRRVLQSHVKVLCDGSLGVLIMLAPSDASAFSGARYSSERCSLFGSLPVWSMVYQRRKVTAHSKQGSSVLQYIMLCKIFFSPPVPASSRRLLSRFKCNDPSLKYYLASVGMTNTYAYIGCVLPIKR